MTPNELKRSCWIAFLSGADDIIRQSAPAKKERLTETNIGVEIELLRRFLCRSADVSRRLRDETGRLGPLDGAERRPGAHQTENHYQADQLPESYASSIRAVWPARGHPSVIPRPLDVVPSSRFSSLCTRYPQCYRAV